MGNESHRNVCDRESCPFDAIIVRAFLTGISKVTGALNLFSPFVLISKEKLEEARRKFPSYLSRGFLQTATTPPPPPPSNFFIQNAQFCMLKKANFAIFLHRVIYFSVVQILQSYIHIGLSISI